MIEDDYVLEPDVPEKENDTFELFLLRHQKQFVDDTGTLEIASVGGFGCGKSHQGAAKMIVNSAVNAKFMTAGMVNLLLAPSDRQIREAVMPAFEYVLGEAKIPYDKKGSPDLSYTLHFSDGDVRVLLASCGGDTSKFRSLKCASIGVDEADTIDAEKMEELWVSLTSRLRGGADGCRYQIYVTTTPEGFGFCHKHWVEDIENDPKLASTRRLIKGKTRWNPFNGPHYLPMLEKQYPKHLLTAYLEGEFVNLEGNIVYPSFDRAENATTRTLDDFDTSLPIHMGVDFNNNKTCGMVAIGERGNVYFIDEITSQKNTFALVDEIKARFPNRRVIVYPDAAGSHQSTNADQSNLEILRRSFEVLAHSKNPRVSDRVNSMNAMFCNGQGTRRMFVNLKKCPVLVKSLEQQKYRGGEPDKKHDQDHPVDAAGYLIWYRFPIKGNHTYVTQYAGAPTPPAAVHYQFG